MPLRCDHRLLGLQIIKSRQDLAVGAVRTIAFPVHTVGDNRTEGMPLVTEPPHAAIGICAHRLRRQRTVLFPIPLFSKLRMQRSEIIESGQDLLSRAERTACVDVTRLATLACQLCPFGHLHQTFWCAPGMTCVGSSGEFFSVSHSESRSGNFAAREFSSGRTARPAQTGQPVPRTRILTSER